MAAGCPRQANLLCFLIEFSPALPAHTLDRYFRGSFDTSCSLAVTVPSRKTLRLKNSDYQIPGEMRTEVIGLQIR